MFRNTGDIVILHGIIVRPFRDRVQCLSQRHSRWTIISNNMTKADLDLHDKEWDYVVRLRDFWATRMGGAVSMDPRTAVSGGWANRPCVLVSAMSSNVRFCDLLAGSGFTTLQSS